MARRYSSFEPNSTTWLLQRVTAAFLVVALAFHFFQLHFVTHAYEIEWADTTMRMGDPAYFATMVLFLVAAAFHGLNGVYAALLNQGLDGTPKRVAKWGLIGIGALLVLQGLRVAAAMAGVTVS